MTKNRLKNLLLAGVFVFSQLVLTSVASQKAVTAAVPGVNVLISETISGVGASGGNSIRISGDGRYVVFAEDSNQLVPNDTNGQRDIFIRDVLTGTTTRASVNSEGEQGNGRSDRPQISNDGRYIVFSSFSWNLSPDDNQIPNNNLEDVYRHDQVTGTTELVSRRSAGFPGDTRSRWPAISGDGRYVVFSSHTLSLEEGLSGATNYMNLFIRDMVTGQTELLSKNVNGDIGNNASLPSDISCDGSVITFQSAASNLVPNDTNSDYDVFVIKRTLAGNTITNITAGSDNGGTPDWPAVSCDGKYVTYSSNSTNLVSGDSNSFLDVFRYDVENGTTELVSKNINGQIGNKQSGYPTISHDGRYISFHSLATNLTTSHTLNGSPNQVFIKDMTTGIVELVSVDSSNEASNQRASVFPWMSSDGKYIAYQSGAALIPADDNAQADIYRSETGAITDNASPSVIGTPDRVPNSSGWYDGDVAIDWQATDDSGSATDPADTVASLEGEHTYTSGQSCDPSGNCATGSLTLKIDKTAPNQFTVSNPVDGATISGVHRFYFQIIDNASGIKKIVANVGGVSYSWLDGNPAGSIKKDPVLPDTWYIDVNTNNLPNGTHHIVLRATDFADNIKYWNNRKNLHSFEVVN